MKATHVVLLVVAVAMAGNAIHGMATGKMRVKGAGLYVREENPGGFRFMVATHVIVAGILAAMALMGIPP